MGIDGSDDYVWTYSDTHTAEYYGNIHNPPYWQIGTKKLFSAQRSRRSLHIADWDGDGKCDVLSQRKSDGALEMWRNNYNPSTGVFNFQYVGFVSGASGCTEGWGVGQFDRGLRLADIEYVPTPALDHAFLRFALKTCAWRLRLHVYEISRTAGLTRMQR